VILGLAAHRRPSVLSRCPLPTIGERVARDAQEPGRKRRASPLEAAQVGERIVEARRSRSAPVEWR
jgi:hypothetical protein